MRLILLITLASLHLASGRLLAKGSKQFNTLKKVTVGPYDNYQGSVGDKSLFFTRSQNLADRIYKLDIGSRNIEAFVDSKAGSKGPVLSPDGRYLAFTYYKYDSQGDICMIDVEKGPESLKCLNQKKKIREEAPFWFSNKEIGYLSRPINGSYTSLIKHHIESNKKLIMRKGDLFAPTASRDGRYLSFSQKTKNGHRLFFGEIKQNKYRPVALDLPGLSGISKFSEDLNYLYFSHYLNDTNYDGAIDADDHSVIFRVRIKDLSKKRVFPEQISSVENNCNFPIPTSEKLYMTCAFEGSLDLYETPLEGRIPNKWDLKDMWNAHQVARTYKERLHILNTIKYRFKHDKRDMWERLFANHLQIEDTTAGLYYINKLISIRSLPTNIKVRYRLLKIYLQALQLRRLEPIDRLSLRFKRRIGALLAKLNKVGNLKQELDFIELVKSYCYLFTHRYDQVSVQIKANKNKAGNDRFFSFLGIRLYELMSKDNVPAKYRLKASEVEQQYLAVLKQGFVAQEGKIYYAVKYLKSIERLAIKQRLVLLDRLASSLKKSSSLSKLFETEAMSLELIGLNDRKKESALFKKMRFIFKETEKDYFLRRAIYVRSLKVLATSKKVRYLGIVASNWLRYTHHSSIEFDYAAQQFGYVNKDKGYGYWHSKDYDRASVAFFQGIVQTDDLESHFNYTMLLTNELKDQKKLEQSYQNLQKHNMIDEQNFKFHQASLLLNGAQENPKKNIADIDEAISLLESMEFRGFNPGMRYQLLGLAYHLKVQLSVYGQDYDKIMFDHSHRNYMLALDLGYDDVRVKAAVLENLGYLHLLVRNFDLSAAYFKKRGILPFLNLSEQIQFRWSYANSLFYSHQADEAQKQVELVLFKLKYNHVAFWERAAFFSAVAKDYKKSHQYYSKLWQIPAFKSPRNRSKAYLQHGYVLSKLKQKKLAQRQLMNAINVSKKAGVSSVDARRLLAFRPERLQMIAWGLLAHNENNPKLSVGYRLKRLRILNSIRGRLKEFVSNETQWLGQVSKEELKIALEYEKLRAIQKSQVYLKKSLGHAREWADLGNGYVGVVSYQTLMNLLSFALSHPKKFRSFSNGIIENFVASTMNEFSTLTQIQAVQIYQKLKLAILWQHYRKKILLDKSLATLSLDKELVDELKTSSPHLWKELGNLNKALATTVK